jgi:hypothetical protein
MDVHEAIRGLDPTGEDYRDGPMPRAEDSRIGRAVKAFTEAEPAWQATFREAIDADRAELLCAWSERVAGLAVRLDSPRPLVVGLVGLSLAADAEAEDGEAPHIAPLHRRSAERLAADVTRLFDEAAGLTDLPGARWLTAARDSGERFDDAGYVEDEDADGFRYLRATGALRRRR